MITTEQMHKKLTDEKKKRIVIKVGNGNAFDFVRYTSFYVSFKRHNQRQVESNTWHIEIFVYQSDYELTKSNLRFIKTEYRDFKLTHLYKYNKVFNVLEDGQETILLVQKNQTNGSLTKHILQ